MAEHTYAFTIVIEPAPEGGYTVTVPAIPEICTEGETVEEAKRMAQDAIRCVIESNLKAGEPLPRERDELPRVERIEVTAAA